MPSPRQISRQVADQPQQVDIADFVGMAPGMDPYDITPGTTRWQVNAVATYPGELRVRRGVQVLRFQE